MTWNYQIVKYRDSNGFGLHEVYYNGSKPVSMTKEPCSFACELDEGPKCVIKALSMALKDAQERPIFEEPEEWLK